jgi:hypothetical protein
MAIFLYERYEHGKHGDLVSKPYFQNKECEKNLKMGTLASFAIFANKDKITELQNALDQPPLVHFCFGACQQNPFESCSRFAFEKIFKKITSLNLLPFSACPLFL